MAGPKVVDDRDLMPGVHGQLGNDGTDVSGPARDQELHASAAVRVPRLERPEGINVTISSGVTRRVSGLTGIARSRNAAIMSRTARHARCPTTIVASSICWTLREGTTRQSCATPWSARPSSPVIPNVAAPISLAYSIARSTFGDDPLVLPPIYLLGVWLSILLAIGVTSLYAFQVTEEARKLSDALAATELVLTREQHLTQIDGLAAAAAHELGTPLSTIFLISRELEKTVDGNDHLAADLRTLREQAQRCRDILAKITQLSSSGAPFDRMPLSTLIEETVAPHRDFGVAIKVRLAVAATREPVGARNPAILYGVGNILENAVDFARTTVEVNAWWNADTVEIVISDDGPGIAPDMLKRIGEPYLSRRRSADDAQSERTGLGLGVFIARTLLERTGAKVSFTNRTFPDHGAVVQIAWPRERFEADEADAGSAD